jgi:hypothetical protein
VRLGKYDAFVIGSADRFYQVQELRTVENEEIRKKDMIIVIYDTLGRTMPRFGTAWNRHKSKR